ncbi:MULTISPECIES: hypothetical protein [unclassified Bradyrhizobium]|uniref:hypothetical protein n=1 Tax=Bradyrhizobium sp. USDA 4541 TaxID=2817704 RepID=UPI0020A38507|nr:hypothetical protein [Bradyrhizobium sp. USDA 4541]MCP1852812.1 hypothetical protein [Bradyrhizobium sp. USDA 4541]
MPIIVCHDGAIYRAEIWGFRGTCALIHKASGRYAVIRGAEAARYHDAIAVAYLRFGSMPGDTLYAWLWTNAGFHRLAS